MYVSDLSYIGHCVRISRLVPRNLIRKPFFFNKPTLAFSYSGFRPQYLYHLEFEKQCDIHPTSVNKQMLTKLEQVVN